MKKNKGFTLVELLAVISILGLLALVAIPAVSNANSKQKEKLYYDQLSQLISATQNWAMDNTELLRGKDVGCEGHSYEVTLDQLKNIDESLDNTEKNVTYLDKEFKNPKTGDDFSNRDTFVWIYKKDKSYFYCVRTPECEEAKYDEYKDTASQICCYGESFQNRLDGCKID